ncbi:hypothetical protein BC833DRAFT_605328 [Globomyces pollinis-pini]|nr:hypothetical protein BC833DRAFT_605328 [Globomyces pollinis-pini]
MDTVLDNLHLLKRILIYLSPLELVLCERLSRKFFRNLEKLDCIWKRLAIIQYSSDQLSQSFATWKLLYACKLQFENGVHDFRSSRSSLILPAGNWDSIRNRTSKSVSVDCSRPIVYKFPGQMRSYLAVIPHNPTNYSKYGLFGNILYFVQLGGFNQQIVYGKYLDNTTTKTVCLHGHTNPVTYIFVSDNGYLVSLDKGGLALIWDIKKFDHKKPIGSIPFITGNPDAYSIGVYKNLMVMMTLSGVILVWDLVSEQLLSQFSLPYEHINRRNTHGKICIRERYMGIAFSTGTQLFFEMRKSLPQSLFPFNYELIWCIDDCIHSDDESNLIAFDLNQSFLIKCFRYNEDIYVSKFNNWKYISTPKLSQFTSSDLFHIQNQQKEVTKEIVTLSETKSMKRFGINAHHCGEVVYATMDKNESMILAISSEDFEPTRLLVWDFRVNRQHDRYFELISIGNMKFFVGFDVTQK